MYTYILILVLGNYNLGIATTQIEFKNYEYYLLGKMNTWFTWFMYEKNWCATAGFLETIMWTAPWLLPSQSYL